MKRDEGSAVIASWFRTQTASTVCVWEEGIEVTDAGAWRKGPGSVQVAVGSEWGVRQMVEVSPPQGRCKL